jgi:hypothetical protein
MDVFKGIELKLQAFERVLEHHSEWRNKLVLVQVGAGLQAGRSAASPEQRLAAGARACTRIGLFPADTARRGAGTVPALPPLSHPPLCTAPSRRADHQRAALQRQGHRRAALAHTRDSAPHQRQVRQQHPPAGERMRDQLGMAGAPGCSARSERLAGRGAPPVPAPLHPGESSCCPPPLPLCLHLHRPPQHVPLRPIRPQPLLNAAGADA